jgi:hypothetical protein
MADLIWTSPAFLVLEKLPQATAFGIVRQVDHLRKFPEMGPLIMRPKHLSKYRQLIYKHTYRTIYRFDEIENCVRIVHLHNCRQKLPSARRLNQALKDTGELPLE